MKSDSRNFCVPLLLFFICFFPFEGKTQSPAFSEGLQIGMDLYHGVLWKHHPDMQFELPNPVSGVSLEVMKQTFGRDYWSAVYRYPRFGWVLHMHNFGNPEVLGTAWATYPQLDIFLFRKPRFRSFLRLGFGIAYVDRSFDRVTNPGNTAIGSDMNNLTTVGLGLEYRPFSALLLRVGGHLTHVSNGKSQLPNLGINTATLRFGVSYELKPQADFIPFEKESHPVDKRWLANIRWGIGQTESKVPDGPKYHVFIFSAFASRMLSLKSKLQLGAEVSYNEANQSWLRNQNITDNKDPDYRPWRFGVIVGHELMFGRIGFLTQALLYADPPFATKSFLGVKLGPNIYLYRPHMGKPFNVFIGMYMKSHYQVAELMEATVGVSF